MAGGRLACVSVALHDCVLGVGHAFIVRWGGDGRVDVKLVDDEVRLEPPACETSQSEKGRTNQLHFGAWNSANFGRKHVKYSRLETPGRTVIDQLDEDSTNKVSANQMQARVWKCKDQQN